MSTRERPCDGARGQAGELESGSGLSVPLGLRALTPARVLLERTGSSVATRHALDLSSAHARARDAVHSTLDVAALLTALRNRNLEAIAVHSAATGRTEYLRRPDLGRILSPTSIPLLEPHTSNLEPRTSNLTIILADGLSALATQAHAISVLDALILLLNLEDPDPVWFLAPVVIAEQARVALGDEIGVALHADITVMLIGERPGLSSPDSLGAYITWAPRPGRCDAERNCVSNIHGKGLDYVTAAAKIAWYVGEGRRLGLTGVSLRESETTLLL